MKCDELKVQKIGDLCFDFKMGKNIEPYYYRKSEVDAAIDELKKEIKRTQKIANEQTFKLCVEKENVWQLEELLRKQKIKRAEDELKNLIECAGIINTKLEREVKKYERAFSLKDEEKRQLEEQLRKQKIKRAEAMARWCRTSARYDEGIGAFKYMAWYLKWFIRWREIADKLKEKKS